MSSAFVQQINVAVCAHFSSYLELMVLLWIELLVVIDVQVEVQRRRQTIDADLKVLVSKDSFTTTDDLVSGVEATLFTFHRRSGE